MMMMMMMTMMMTMVAYPVDHHAKSPFGRSYHPHAMMNATGTETTLCNLKATPFTDKNVVQRNTNVLKLQLCMTICIATSQQVCMNNTGENNDHVHRNITTGVHRCVCKIQARIMTSGVCELDR